jgi:transposase InsO family protein
MELALLNHAPSITVTKVHVVENDPAAAEFAAQLEHLWRRHSRATAPVALDLPADLKAIEKGHLAALSLEPDCGLFVLGGWECRGRSAAGKGLGADDSRDTFLPVLQIIQWCQQLYPGRVNYLLENVTIRPEETREAVLADERRAHGALGVPFVSDATQLCSYAARVRSVWTNAAPVSYLRSALAVRRRPPARERPLSAVLRPGAEVALCSTRSTPAPGFPCNKYGEPIVVFPCLVSYRDSAAFAYDADRPDRVRHGLLRVLDSQGCARYVAPNTTERDLILGYPYGYTAAIGNDDTRFRLQGQTVDQFQFGFVFGTLDDYGVAAASLRQGAAETFALDCEDATTHQVTIGVHFEGAGEAVLTVLANRAGGSGVPPEWEGGGTALPLTFPPCDLIAAAATVAADGGGPVVRWEAAAPPTERRNGAQGVSPALRAAGGTGDWETRSADRLVITGLGIDAGSGAAGQVISSEHEQSELLSGLDLHDTVVPLKPDSPVTHSVDEIKLGEQLSAGERAAARQLLEECKDIFAWDVSELGDINLGGPMRIRLKPDTRPVHQRQRQLPADDVAAVLKEVQQLLDQGIIKPSTSAWCANLVVVRKKNGERRICVDNRALNSATEMDNYPFPQVQHIFDKVAQAGSKIFSVCDMFKGYWQLRIAEEDQHLTAFAVPGMGQFEFRRVNFGLKTAPAAFVRMVDQLLAPLPNTEGFVDDLLTHSEDFSAALAHLRQLFFACRAANAKLAPLKCHLLCSEVVYVGHMLSGEGVRPTADKVAAVRDAPDPAGGADEVRRFLGLAGYLRQYVKDFSALAAPLTALLKKGVPAGPWGPSVWGAAQEKACHDIREALCRAPTLRHVVPHRRLRISSDWSVLGGSGAVLSQFDDNGNEYVCGYWSKSNTPAERNYGAFKGELLSALSAIQHWHCYVGSNVFELMVDHRALIWLFTAKELSPMLARYVLRLNEYNIHIVYRPGAENFGADYLSRKPPPAGGGAAGLRLEAGVYAAELAGWGPACDDWVAEGQALQAAVELSHVGGEGAWRDLQWASGSAAAWALASDSEGVGTREPWDDVVLLDCLRRGAPALDALGSDERDRVQHRLKRYRLETTATGVELLFFVYEGGTRLVPRPAERAAIVRDIHAREVAHMGVQRTYSAVGRLYRWHAMYSTVEDVVRTCAACNLAKTAAPLRSLELRPLPLVHFFHRVSLDLAGPFPTSLFGSVMVLIVIEHLSRAVFPRAIPNKEAITIAREFNYFCGTFGAPAEVLTDVGSEFQGEFDDVCTRLFIAHNVTSAYHPQGNGLTERSVQTVKRLLTACLLGQEVGTDWETVLPAVQLAINSTPQASTKLSPYEIVFGRPIGVPAAASAGRLRTLLPDDWTAEQVTAELVERVKEIQRLVPYAMSNLLTQQRRQTLAYARRTGGGGGFRHELLKAVPGNLVFVRDRTATNLQPAVRQGVFMVVEVRQTGVVIIQGRNGRTTAVHTESLVPCHLRDTDIDLTITPADEAPADLACEWCSVCEQSSGLKAMLLCDLCQTGWHLGCLPQAQPVAPKTLPAKAKAWYCVYCVRVGRVPVPVTATGVALSMQAVAAMGSSRQELTSAEAVRVRLHREMPGPHGAGRAVRLFNLMPGQPNFCEAFGHGSGFIRTPPEDYAVLRQAIDWDSLGTVLDPWAGAGGTAAAFPRHRVILTDVVNRTPRLSAMANALEPSHQDELMATNGGQFDAVVCSPAFAFLDLAVPAGIRCARYLAAFHVPGGYVTDAPPARKAFLQKLDDEGRRVDLYGLPILKQTGVRHIWIVVFASRQDAQRLLLQEKRHFSAHRVLTSRQ